MPSEGNGDPVKTKPHLIDAYKNKDGSHSAPLSEKPPKLQCDPSNNKENLPSSPQSENTQYCLIASSEDPTEPPHKFQLKRYSFVSPRRHQAEQKDLSEENRKFFASVLEHSDALGSDVDTVCKLCNCTIWPPVCECDIRDNL